MYLLAYFSTATKVFSEDDLMELLRKSRENNQAMGITGLLLYNDSNFMQFLEGSKEAVLSLLAKIQSDPRHHHLVVVLHEEHSVREFNEWSMGFKKLDPEAPIVIPGFVDFDELPLTREIFLLHPTESLLALLNFKSLLIRESAEQA